MRELRIEVWVEGADEEAAAKPKAPSRERARRTSMVLAGVGWQRVLYKAMWKL
jgi:hypothetical protein